MLHVVLYGCERWFLILKEDYRMKVSEYKVLRTVFGPKRNEVHFITSNFIMFISFSGTNNLITVFYVVHNWSIS